MQIWWLAWEGINADLVAGVWVGVNPIHWLQWRQDECRFSGQSVGKVVNVDLVAGVRGSDCRFSGWSGGE